MILVRLVIKSSGSSFVFDNKPSNCPSEIFSAWLVSVLEKSNELRAVLLKFFINDSTTTPLFLI
jgi:hypothetical protein